MHSVKFVSRAQKTARLASSGLTCVLVVTPAKNKRAMSV